MEKGGGRDFTIRLKFKKDNFGRVSKACVGGLVHLFKLKSKMRKV